jgi:hypothetical protein
VGSGLNGSDDVFIVNGDQVLLVDGLLQEESATRSETIGRLNSISFDSSLIGKQKCANKSHPTPFGGAGGFVGDYEVCATYLGRRGNTISFDFERHQKGPLSGWIEFKSDMRIAVDVEVPCRVHLLSAVRSYPNVPGGRMFPATHVRMEICSYLVEK